MHLPLGHTPDLRIARHSKVCGRSRRSRRTAAGAGRRAHTSRLQLAAERGQLRVTAAHCCALSFGGFGGRPCTAANPSLLHILPCVSRRASPPWRRLRRRSLRRSSLDRLLGLVLVVVVVVGLQCVGLLGGWRRRRFLGPAIPVRRALGSPVLLQGLLPLLLRGTLGLLPTLLDEVQKTQTLQVTCFLA